MISDVVAFLLALPLRRTAGPGTPCPAVETVTSLSHDTCCPMHSYGGVTCAFDSVATRMVSVDDYYGGYVPATWTSTDVVDVCYYEGLFEVTDVCCGRPLQVEGRAMTARPTRGADWLDRPVPEPHSEALRREGAAYWLQAALMEHASVASFARFTLELFQFGAPPELLAASQRASLDEIEHARLCFSLAAGLSGDDVGPAPLDLRGAATLSTTLAEFAEAVAREGCIGETLAALDAAARLRRATDPAVRAALEAIVRDESSHAALAWRTLRWVLTLDRDGAVARRLDGVFAEASRRSDRGEPVVEGGAAVGLLADHERDAVFAEGWERVIRPAWSELARPSGPA